MSPDELGREVSRFAANVWSRVDYLRYASAKAEALPTRTKRGFEPGHLSIIPTAALRISFPTGLHHRRLRIGLLLPKLYTCAVNCRQHKNPLNFRSILNAMQQTSSCVGKLNVADKMSNGIKSSADRRRPFN
jgi:hypothetical protein